MDVERTHLDCDAKQWRLFADLLNDIAIFIEIVAPFFPAIFTLVVCISCIFKAVVGVSGGATRAALTSHQARRDNMADVSAKDGSQETLVNLAGLCTGLLLTPLAANSTLLTYLLFFLFTSLHLYANVRAVRSVVMETVNRGRLRILLEDFLREGTVPSPPSVNAREPLLPVLWEREKLILGAPLHRVVGRLVCPYTPDRVTQRGNRPNMPTNKHAQLPLSHLTEFGPCTLR